MLLLSTRWSTTSDPNGWESALVRLTAWTLQRNARAPELTKMAAKGREGRGCHSTATSVRTADSSPKVADFLTSRPLVPARRVAPQRRESYPPLRCPALEGLRLRRRWAQGPHKRTRLAALVAARSARAGQRRRRGALRRNLRQEPQTGGLARFLTVRS